MTTSKNPFQKKSEAPLEEMVAFLESKGYVVKKLKEFKSFSDQSVIACFYTYLSDKYGISYAAQCKDYEKKSKAALKEFQTNIISFGYTKQFGNFLVVKILEAVFSNYDRIGIENRIRSLEDVITERGLWMLSKISRFGNVGTWAKGSADDAEWYEDFINRVCASEDVSLTEMREKRKKELMMDGEKENKRDQ